MADREREKKKKRAYLDDFEKDLNGNYQYRGAHYRYAGEHPHTRVLALLWLFCCPTWRHWCWRCMRWCCWCG